MAQKRRLGQNGGCLRQSLKILRQLALAVVIILGALYITGKFLTNRIETETDTYAFESWGPGASFIDTRSGNVHILDIGEGDVILLIHGSTGSIADWQESVAYPLAESYRVVAFDSYGFGLSERKKTSEYGHALWEQQFRALCRGYDGGPTGRGLSGAVSRCGYNRPQLLW